MIYKEPQIKQTLNEKLEAAGCKKVPDDHWIYSEGASTHFLSRKLPPEPNKLAQRLIVELTQSCRDEISVDATDVESMLDLDEGESITWVSSTWIEPELVNLFTCAEGQEPISVVATHHGDRGVLMRVSDAFETVAATKEYYGNVPEGWTDMT